jgi:predicted nucleic acid-binding protein
MNSPICVDASFVLKLFLPENDSDKAHWLWSTWLGEDAEIVAPYHLAYETVSVLRNNVHSQTISAEKGELAFEAFLSQMIRLLHPPNIVERAWSLAAQFQRPTAYDAYYVALADLLGCELWTADRRLFNAVQHALPWVKYLADFHVTSSQNKDE